MRLWPKNWPASAKKSPNPESEIFWDADFQDLKFSFYNRQKLLSALICANLRPMKMEVKEMPNQVGQVYVCEICGNKVKMLVAGKGQLVCCGQPMKLTAEK
jgi:desulfoferrodoxin-like iron-binding protein